MTTQTLLVTLQKVDCCVCGMIFGVEESTNRRLINDRGHFFCPSGHSQHYTGEPESDRLKREIAQLQSRVEYKDAAIRGLNESNDKLRRSTSALRGVHTRTCNRIKNGVCPCCNRTFANLAAHMHTKHPEFKGAQVA